MPRTFGVKHLLNKNFKRLGLDGPWLETFGHLSDPFTLLVFGHPKNGKTSLLMQFSKYLTRFGKVWYNSIEEGDSATIQDALNRCNMGEVEEGKFMLGDRYFYAHMMEKLARPNSGRFVVIDSRDYINLTTTQWKKLTTTFPHKSFILVCWEGSAGKPAGKFAQDIQYMVDLVIHVKSFRAYCDGRFGGGKPFVIWNKNAGIGEQLQLQ